MNYEPLSTCLEFLYSDLLFIDCTYIHLDQKLRHTGENWEIGLTSFAPQFLSLPYLPTSASLCPLHLCCNTSSPPFRYTSLPDSPPPTTTTPLPPRYLTSLPFSPTFPSHSLFLSLHSPPCLPEHPALNLALNPCTQRSVTGQMFWSLAGEMLWGELRGARGLDWGPLPGPAVYTKDGRNWFSLDAQVFELTV